MSESYPYTQKGQSQAGGDAIRKDASMLGMGYMLLIVFSIIVLSHHKRIHSNGVMALASITCVGLSIVSAFGLCGYCGVRQNPVTTTLFLVLLGIGVDDSYVIMGDYRIAEGDAQTRVVQALTKGGVSIAVTSLTDIVAFAAGISSSLPAISDFCIFAAVGIFFDFFYQCTWFVAALMLRARCTENNRPDWLCCMTVDPESTGCCNCSAPLCSRKGQCVCCPCSRDSPDGTGMGDSAARRTLNKVTALTLTPIGTGVVLFITACILGGAAAGFPKLNTDFDIKWFTPDDAFYKTTYDIQDKYFPTTGKGLPVYVYTKTGDYAAAHSDASLAALYQGTTACAWVDRSVTNWYSDFAKDAGRTSRAQASNAAFTSEVKAFVSSPAGARFAKDISFASDDSSILATRTMYLSKATENGEEDIEMMETIRGCVGTTLSAFAYTRAFLYYDGLAVVDTETITNVLIACACVFVVTLFMLADLLAATLVLTMIGLIDVCILGYMGHWDLDFNSVTAVNLVLAIGLAIDYSAHIAHSFLVIQGPGPERAKRAVDHIGMSVLNGAFSTFLAVLPLGVSQSYVFRVFFKMWFMIIIFGTFFGVIVLPVLLSLFSNCLGAPYVPEAADQTVQVDVKPEGLNPIAVGKAGNKDEVYLQKE